VQPARAVVGDDDSLREHAAGFAAAPFRVEQIDVHGEYHAGAEFVSDRLERPHVGALGMVAVAGIFQRGEPVAVNAGLADAEAAPFDGVAHRVHDFGDLCARLEQIEPAPVGGKARVVNVEIARLGLAQAERALDVGEIAAEFGMHLADDHVALRQRPRGGHAEWVRIGVRVGRPQEQGRLLAAVRQHHFHHARIDLALLDVGARGVAARLQHEIAERGGLFQNRDLLGAFDGAQLLRRD
jgi:hypothetical protein